MKNEYIRMAPLFMELSADEQSILGESFTDGALSAGESLFSAGQQSDALYLVGTGFVRLTTAGGQNIATLGPGSVLGEDSLFRKTAYDVNAVAVGDLAYWALSDARLRAIVLQHPDIGVKLSDSFGLLIAQMEDYLVQLLGATEELGRLPRNTLQAVAAYLKPVDVTAGTQLYGGGETPKGLYFIQSSRVTLQPETGDGAGSATTAGSGTIFGTAALLTNKQYAESAVVEQDGLIWHLSSADFQTVNAQHPGLRRGLGRAVHAPLGREDRAQAVMRLSAMPIFESLPPQTLEAVARSMQLLHAAAGERVYRIGESGDAIYFIESGEIELTAQNTSGVVEELARIGSDGFFGEQSLITGQIRTEDATAIRHTNLWVLHKSELDRLAEQHPAIGMALSDAIASRLAAESAGEDVQRLRRFQLFSNLGDDELLQVSKHLEPDRFRAGEQIQRANDMSTRLYLLEEGEVRIQPLSGGSWIVGPGESFGERSLLSNQPGNATVFAETDVDVWALSKDDFDMLLARYPGLAINISRMLSERLEQQAAGVPAAAMAPDMQYTQQPLRRNMVDTAPASRRRGGFGPWYSGLTGWGKVRFGLLLLLLIWLIAIAVPWALWQIIQGTGMASPAALVAGSSDDAIGAVARLGSYEVAAMDSDLAEQVAMADSQVAPTATYTPPPTATPLPTNTPLPTATPLPTRTPTPVPVVAAPVVQEVIEPEPAPEIQTASVRPRSWDPRLNQLGVSIEDANVQPGERYWRLVDAVWWDEQESAGKHHVYVEVLDQNGNRLVNHPVTVFWGDGSHTGNTEDKAPPDYGFNYQMYAAGYAYNVKVDGLPSEVVKGVGMGSIEQRFYGIHTSFLLTFQETVK